MRKLLIFLLLFTALLSLTGCNYKSKNMRTLIVHIDRTGGQDIINEWLKNSNVEIISIEFEPYDNGCSICYIVYLEK